MEEVVRMSVDKDKRGVLEVSLWTRDGTRQVEKVDLGVFYRSCLTSWGKGSQHRPDCIRGCPRPYLDPQGMLDDMGLFHSLFAQMQGEVLLLHPLLLTRALMQVLSRCPRNNTHSWLFLYLCVISLGQTASCFEMIHDRQHLAQRSSAMYMLSWCMTQRDASKPIKDKLRDFHEITENIAAICNDGKDWRERACPCGHSSCPVNTALQQNMQLVLLQVHHALQEFRSQRNRALRMAANNTQEQNLLLDWPNVLWTHIHALMQNIIRANLEPVTTRLANDLLDEEAAQKSRKAKKQARIKPETLAESAPQHADNSVEALFTCPLTKGRLQDPVIAADGHTYERQAMERWVATSDVSPATGAKLKHVRLVPNVIIRSMLGM